MTQEKSAPETERFNAVKARINDQGNHRTPPKVDWTINSKFNAKTIQAEDPNERTDAKPKCETFKGLNVSQIINLMLNLSAEQFPHLSTNQGELEASQNSSRASKFKGKYLIAANKGLRSQTDKKSMDIAPATLDHALVDISN